MEYLLSFGNSNLLHVDIHYFHQTLCPCCHGLAGNLLNAPDDLEGNGVRANSLTVSCMGYRHRRALEILSFVKIEAATSFNMKTAGINQFCSFLGL